jgi:hypothetical protein
VLAEIVRTIVRSGLPATIEAVRRSIPTSVPPNDQEGLVKLVLEEFRSIHTGNSVRFGLRPLEFEAWIKTSATLYK